MICLTSHWTEIRLIWILSIVVNHTLPVTLMLTTLKLPNTVTHVLSADDALLVGFSHETGRSLLVRVVECLEAIEPLQIVLPDIDWCLQSLL